jgi:hypothetical protein
MPAELAGVGTAFFLYDVADAIDLQSVATLVGPTSRARLTPKTATPSYVQYQQPPLTIDGDVIGLPEVLGFSVRFKLFDYGVISVALSRPLPATWADVIDAGLAWHDDARLGAACETLCRDLAARLQPALTAGRTELVAEDYLVFSVTDLVERPSADALLERHGDEIVRLLRGEREPLSRQEREEVLRHRISYFEHDLLVPTWNAAFVYDTESGAQAATEIVEFANSQLLEFRYYDSLLTRELSRIYSELQNPRWFKGWGGRRYTRAAQQVHALFIDVNELTDRAENALKVAGDVYTARVLTLTASRIGLDSWKANVSEKLKTLDDIYRFAVEQTGMARGEGLELAVVLILIFELILFFMGIMRA